MVVDVEAVTPVEPGPSGLQKPDSPLSEGKGTGLFSLGKAGSGHPDPWAPQGRLPAPSPSGCLPSSLAGDVNAGDPAEMKVLQGETNRKTRVHCSPGLWSSGAKALHYQGTQRPLARQGAKGVGAGSGNASAEDQGARRLGRHWVSLISPPLPRSLHS